MKPSLDARLAALASAAETARGRLDDDAVDAAEAVVSRAGQRLGHGLEATVVALAGPTGAGKSSLFNALAGAELSRSSRRRPTTAAATAAYWGQSPDALLDWLDVPMRHPVPEPADLAGLVVLDLPDFDSVERANRLEADRLVELVDLLIWVADPQKYADSSLHDLYLRPLNRHRDAMLVALNQADRLDADALASCRADLGRLLVADGLDGVPVIAVSALTGTGMDDLRRVLREKVRRRGAALARLGADVEQVVATLASSCGGREPKVDASATGRLVSALEQAAGVPSVVGAVGSAHRRRGALAVGWPFLRWMRRFRPDPLKRLHLTGMGDSDVRTSLPRSTAVQQAQVSSATRTLARAAGDGLEEPWPRLLREAATEREPELADRLDSVVARTELPVRPPLWWKLVGPLQILLAIAAIACVLWLLTYVVLGYLQLGDLLPVPRYEGIPVPTAALVLTLGVGLLLAIFARFANGAGARRRQRRSARALRSGVERVAGELVVEPLEEELAARESLCGQLAVARGKRR